MPHATPNTPPLPDRKYGTIYADPPWKYGSWGPGSNRALAKGFSVEKAIPIPYPTMSVKDICELQVSTLADKNCELYLWTTQKYLPSAFVVIDAWGFKYCQTITWCKRPRGLGQGGIFCPTTEFLLLARKGKMPKVRRIDSTWFLTKRPHNHHSKKPDFFRDLIATITIPPRIELFARQTALGWDAWGNEVSGEAA